MKELLMHISQEPGRFLDVLNVKGERILPNREPAEKVTGKLEELIAQHGQIEVRSFRKTGIHFVDRKEFHLKHSRENQNQNNTTPQQKSPAQTKDPNMKDPHTEVQMILLQNQNEWLKNSHEKLERENSDLRVSNEKLRMENNDLTIKHHTSEKEKELALKHQEVSQKKGLGSIGSPEEINSFLTGIADMIKSFKGDGSDSGSKTPALPSLTSVKQEVLQFVGEKMNSIDDDHAQKLAFIIKTVIERDKVDYLYSSWTENNAQA